MSYERDSIIFNRGHHGKLTEETIAAAGRVAYFEGGAGEPGYEEAKQWLEAIFNNTEPLVKLKEAFVVTQIWRKIEALNGGITMPTINKSPYGTKKTKWSRQDSSFSILYGLLKLTKQLGEICQ